MEHAQRYQCFILGFRHGRSVLILILMEHAQRSEIDPNTFATKVRSLNPYFNGTCSKIFIVMHNIKT